MTMHSLLSIKCMYFKGTSIKKASHYEKLLCFSHYDKSLCFSQFEKRLCFSHYDKRLYFSNYEKQFVLVIMTSVFVLVIMTIVLVLFYNVTVFSYIVGQEGFSKQCATSNFQSLLSTCFCSLYF